MLKLVLIAGGALAGLFYLSEKDNKTGIISEPIAKAKRVRKRKKKNVNSPDTKSSTSNT